MRITSGGVEVEGGSGASRVGTAVNNAARRNPGSLAQDARIAEQAILSLLCHAYFYFSAFIGSILIALVRLASRPLDRHGRLPHTLTRWLAFHYVAFHPGWSIEYEGLEHLESGGPFVIVANHQSLIDVLVLARLDGLYKWIAKHQVYFLPGVAQLMRINDYVAVAHGDLASVRRMMRCAKQWLQRGVSVLVFPEGERTMDGELLEFKDGPFRLACRTSAPILPVVLDGTFHIMRRGTWLINVGKSVRVKVLPPIYPESVDFDARLLNAKARQSMQNELILWRQHPDAK